MDRNDKILTCSLIGALIAIALIAYAPSAVPAGSISSRLWSVASSGFGIALVGSLAGAFAGALGAQWISETTARRKGLLTEIKVLNASIGMCCDVVNAYLVFKKQITRPLCDRYFLDRAQVETVFKSGRAPAVPPLRIQIENRPIDRPFSPIAALERTLQERIVPEGSVLAFLTQLIQAITSLNGALESRENFLKKMMQISPDRQVDLYEAYFALGQSGEIGEGTFPEHIKFIADLTDDCIGIGIILCRVLRYNGKKSAKQFGPSAPKIANVDWGIAEADNLVPDLTKYKEWLQRSFGGVDDLTKVFD